MNFNTTLPHQTTISILTSTPKCHYAAVCNLYIRPPRRELQRRTASKTTHPQSLLIQWLQFVRFLVSASTDIDLFRGGLQRGKEVG
jgi:hypothetical protein